ncbi:MAG: polysaccharide deacetylase [Roseiarcus sp.]
MAGEISCAIGPTEPTHLSRVDAVADYRSVLRLCAGRKGETRVAIREMRLGGDPALLLANPDTLETRLEKSACWSCRDVDETALAATRFMHAILKSAEAPGLTKRGFLENAGLVHGAGGGAFLTADLCPSPRPLARAFIDELPPHTPIALSISGLWLIHHFQDYRWLIERQAAGAIDILWTNHSYHHQFARGVPFDRNFLLTPGVDPDAEILDTERLIIANGQTPSLFFRFPGLVSSAPLMQAARKNHLISLGADAWLALQERPRPGSIVLVHANGNEPQGLELFERDERDGAMPAPLRPLIEAPK